MRGGQAASHQGKGWETFTDEVIKTVDGKDHPVVFILWGSHARKKKALIDTSRHAVPHGEAQAVGLTGPVVRVLSEDHHLHVGERREVQGGEHVVGPGVHRAARSLLGHERLELGPVRLGQLVAQQRVPVRLGRHRT